MGQSFRIYLFTYSPFWPRNVLTLFLNHVEILVEHVLRQFSADTTAVSCFILSKMIVTLQVNFLGEKNTLKMLNFRPKKSRL